MASIYWGCGSRKVVEEATLVNLEVQGLPEWLRPTGTADPERPWIKAILKNLGADKVMLQGLP